MRARRCREILFIVLAAVVTTPVLAQSSFNFEGLIDSTILTNQYTGATFSNTIVLSAGITLNELELPTHAGTSAASDNGGPMTIVFTSPLRSFSGYFTYSLLLTLQAFDSTNHLVASTSSQFSNNEALAGVPGSHPNEVLQVSATASIYKIVITGGAQGASFTVDDVIVVGKCDLNQDGLTTVADAQAAVNEALGAMSGADDLTGDNSVNVVDIQIVINAALGFGCAAK